MCITRVGKVLQVERGKASVKFFDGGSSDDVDVSIVEAKEGSYVEVHGNLALSILSASDARSRRAAWALVRKAIKAEA